MNLRTKLIRTAHQNPELRPHVLPLLKRAGISPTLSWSPRQMLDHLFQLALQSVAADSQVVPEGRGGFTVLPKGFRFTVHFDGLVVMFQLFETQNGPQGKRLKATSLPLAKMLDLTGQQIKVFLVKEFGQYL